MKYQAIDRFEYSYQILSRSIVESVEKLNKLGEDGWEVIQFRNPTSQSGIHSALLKRKITEIEV